MQYMAMFYTQALTKKRVAKLLCKKRSMLLTQTFTKSSSFVTGQLMERHLNKAFAQILREKLNG